MLPLLPFPPPFFSRQPQQPVRINRACSIARGLTSAVVGSMPLFDLVNRGNALSLGGAPGVGYSGLSRGPDLNGSSQYVRYSTIVPASQTEGSMFFLGYAASDVTGGALFDQTTDAAGNAEWGFRAGFFAGSMQVSLSGNFDAGLHSIAATWSGTALTGYWDGALTNTGTATVNGDANYPLSLGCFNYSGGNIFFAGVVPLLALIWDRALDAWEAAALARNPWQIFALPRPGFLLSAAASSPAGFPLLGQACL